MRARTVSTVADPDNGARIAPNAHPRSYNFRMRTSGLAENEIVQLSCAQLARFRAWFATHKNAVLNDENAGLDASDRLEALTRKALAVARQIPADGGACGFHDGANPHP